MVLTVSFASDENVKAASFISLSISEILKSACPRVNKEAIATLVIITFFIVSPFKISFIEIVSLLFLIIT